ncbi:MAG: GNAT family N-acetyltransferase [Caldilineaceae bacterium]
MYTELEPVTLRSGETVTAAIVTGPDAEWASRLVTLLEHKGRLWNWQNASGLERNIGIDANFYILHRDGQPFANILTATYKGVGLFGHVWTKPEDRQQGASSALMARQMAHFGQMQGQALFLGTGWQSVAFRMYEKFGFRSIGGESGYMTYFTDAADKFEAAYFAPGHTEIMPLDWRHWPASQPLFLGAYPTAVRAASMGIIGPGLTEGPLLPVLHDAERRAAEGKPARAVVSQLTESGAVVGMALWDWHPIWPEVCLVDLYCHPNYWGEAGNLLASLTLPDAAHCLAYADADSPAKIDALQSIGFQPGARLKERALATVATAPRFADVLELSR